MIGSCSVLVICAGILLAFGCFGSTGCFLASQGCIQFLTAGQILDIFQILIKSVLKPSFISWGGRQCLGRSAPQLIQDAFKCSIKCSSFDVKQSHSLLKYSRIFHFDPCFMEILGHCETMNTKQVFMSRVCRQRLFCQEFYAFTVSLQKIKMFNSGKSIYK